jgi:hypothetical protein
MTWHTQTYAILGFVVLAFVVMFGFVRPIPQNPAFHDFCDVRGFARIPNVLNVLSNLPFLVVGVMGLNWMCQRPAACDRKLAPAYALFFASLVATAAGSAYYHWAPSNQTLFWDRLPIAVGFMSVFAAVVAERISHRLDLAWLPLALLGAGSVVLWRITDDLRLYGLVKFLPILLIPTILYLYPARWSHGSGLIAAIGAYMVAKLFEDGDLRIYTALGQVVSGHTLKHLAAAFGAWLVYRMLTQRQRIDSAA